jgi:fructokinase
MTTPFSASAIRVAIAGEALIDLIMRPDGAYEPCLGGALYNLARALSRQGVGAVYLNPLSSDRFGRALQQQLHNDGVQLAHEALVQQVTSLAVVSLNASGHPDYAFYREGVADRQVSAGGLNHACTLQPDLKIICTGALALDARDADVYVPWLRAQRQVGHCVVVDANMRPSVMPDLQAYRAQVQLALMEAHVIKVSDEDLSWLDGNSTDPLVSARVLLERSNASLLALTLGAQGAWLLTRDGQCYAREAQALAVVDTVGAGDSFLAGLLAALLDSASPAGLLHGLDARRCAGLLRHALSSASLCVQQRGCVPPSWDETQAWSQAHPAITAAPAP